MTASAFQWIFHWLAWEGFANPELENAWRLHFHASQLSLDFTSCVIAILMTVVDLPQSVRMSRSAPPEQTPYVLVFWISSYACSLTIMWLIRRRRDWYVSHRSAVLIAFKLSRTLLYCLAMWRAGHYYLLYAPLELPSGRWKAIFRSMFLPSLMARFTIMWQLPLADTRLTSSITLALGLYDNFRRCGEELAAVPAQGVRYRAAVEGALNTALRFGLPSPTLGSRLPGDGPAGVSGYGACVAAKSTAQLIVGYGLPMCAVLAIEAASRSIYSLNIGFGYTLRPSLATMAIQNLLLLPLQACLVLAVAVLALRWAGL